MNIESINKELDNNRVDEWHCSIPLSEDGGVMADDLVDFAVDKPRDGYPENADYVLLINEERRGFTEADVIGTSVIQSKEYIYHILKIGDGHGFMASITRINQNKE
jgi:hypothetical protein